MGVTVPVVSVRHDTDRSAAEPLDLLEVRCGPARKAVAGRVAEREGHRGVVTLVGDADESTAS